jgi:hypothetical protein
VYKTLSHVTQKSGRTSESTNRRQFNIQWIMDLPISGLTYQSKVQQILITTTDYGEKIFIQYPGKESVRDDERRRPNDFFPRIFTSKGYSKDYSFWDIWRLLFAQLEPRKNELKNEMRALAAIFYRMAFMVDHNLVNSPQFIVRNIQSDVFGNETLSSEEKRDFPSLYMYNPPLDLVKNLGGIINCGDISFEAFLHYNNLLAWNEDTKYFYRAKLVGKPWIGDVGRINNLLTHISVLGYLVGELETFDIFYKFSTGKGVAPATSTEIQKITSGLIHT